MATLVTIVFMKYLGRKTIFFATSSLVLALLSATTPATASVVSFPGNRPFELFVPNSYDKVHSAPLLLALPGYTWVGSQIEKYLNLTPMAQARGILYVHPTGTLDKAGNHFWNATPACCNFYGSKVNDESYLMTIIDTVSKKFNVDSKRVFIIGHSNGGFMAHRMACTHSDRIAAIVSISGATFADPSQCKPSSPISVLQIWGTGDKTLPYEGGTDGGNPYPGAKQTVANWATLDHCAKKLNVISQKPELGALVKAKTTTISRYERCAANTTVELWTVIGGPHIPSISTDFTKKVVDFLLAHPKTK